MKKLEDKGLVKTIDELASLTRKLILGDSNDNSLLFSAIQKKGIKLFGMQNDYFDGVCLWNCETKEPEIYLNVEQSEDRRLFTLSHELGHLVIDYGWSPFENDEKTMKKNEELLSVSFRDKDKKYDTDDINEQVMNQFAGAFLMPEKSVNFLIQDIDEDEKKIEEVKRYFGVTKKAAKNRLIMLGKING